MRKKLVSCGITLVFLIAILSGCTDSSLDDKKRLVGIWRIEGEEELDLMEYAFLDNGTFFFTKYPNVSGTWDIKDGKLFTDFYGVNSSSYYSFSNNDQTFTLTDLNDPEIKLTLLKIID